MLMLYYFFVNFPIVTEAVLSAMGKSRILLMLVAMFLSISGVWNQSTLLTPPFPLSFTISI